jgi:hypothetical protein
MPDKERRLYLEGVRMLQCAAGQRIHTLWVEFILVLCLKDGRKETMKCIIAGAEPGIRLHQSVCRSIAADKPVPEEGQ